MSKLSEKRAAKLAAKLAAAAAADLAAAADTVAAIGAPPDASPATETVLPVRVRVPLAAAPIVAALPALLMYRDAQINGIGTPKTRDALTVAPVPLTADDVAALYARARTFADAATSPAFYNAADRTGASPLDRMMYAARAAERCIYAADRYASGTRPVRAFSGDYRNTETVKLRAASLLAALSDVTADGALAPYDCDAAIRAHLLSRGVHLRPETTHGYFASNVGTRDR